MELGYSKVVAQICHHTLLSDEEFSKLIKKSNNGCLESRNKIITHNYRLVAMEAHRVAKIYGSDLDDMMQVGFFALQRAVAKFKPSMSCKFSTYANWWIKSFIGRAAVGESFDFHAPIRQKFLAMKIRKSIEADMSNCKELTDMTKVEQSNIHALARNAVSLNNSADSAEESSPLYSIIEDKTYSLDKEMNTSFARDIIRDAMMRSLDDKEQFVLNYRFLHSEETLEGVGRMLNLSKERVRQIESKAKEKLRLALSEHREALYGEA
jgi:RNA polymerase sigma factor (sigma-70 family)